jgi:hypothetical protein
MIVRAIQLLRAREIVHPSRIAGITAYDRKVRVEIAGYPWWLDETARGHEATITFTFEGIAEGWLDPTTIFNFDDDEALEVFVIDMLIDHEWALPHNHEVFCSAPMPDPLALFERVQDYLWRNDAFLTARDILNLPEGLLSRFRAITAGNSYLVGRGPESVRQIICAELLRQDVAHNVVSHILEPKELLLVRLGGSQFVCENAMAEFD